ncbi:hypothetical protein M9Y10_039571 [Tritrichomonas musculus]|uniref:Uncharacterized protein n=1 Tax=Tritrichomonas musculus TaxID=1915356 RepID=A0ABR2KC81_9EUKA
MDPKSDHGKQSSKKKNRSTSSKGKKGVDEGEKLAAGNGWTIAAVQKYLEATTDEERLQQLLAMFSVTEQDYQYDFKSTATINFHFGNALYCTESAFPKFDAHKLQFYCRTLHKMLEMGIQKVQEDPNLDFDALRKELFELFHTNFTEFNSSSSTSASSGKEKESAKDKDKEKEPEFQFTPEETTELIKQVTSSFLRPLRLILHPFYIERSCRIDQPNYFKVFQPVNPVPLSECTEILPVIEEDKEFPILNIPQDGTMNLEAMKNMIKMYTDGIIATIEKRYDVLDDQVAKLNPLTSPQ